MTEDTRIPENPDSGEGNSSDSSRPETKQQATGTTRSSFKVKDSSVQVGPGAVARVKRGARPGDRYVRVMRANQDEVNRIPTRYVQLSEESLTGKGSLWRHFKRLLVGRPIATAQSHLERLNKLRALAVYASDALSSVAYATEATLFVLVTAHYSAHPTQYVIPISIAICILIALVVNSYRQTVYAYPNGGGSYIVTKDNLGTNAGLVAAAAILIDYTLTVAVSTTAGVLAITSAFPFLNPYQVEIGILLLGILTLANLRGIRESGTIFAIPTYIFIFSFLGLIGFGIFQIVTGNYVPYPSTISELKASTTEIHEFNTQPLTLFLVLVAFTQGCSALTGVEAISDGVQSFKKPESRNAAITLVVLGVLLITFFMGTSFLAEQLHALPDNADNPAYETVISKIGRNLLGGNSPFYYIVQASTALILGLAANTAFADFPRLSYFLARDKFLPHIFTSRGDRLSYSAGIFVLAALASILVIVSNGHTEALIPLYAIGVFLAFTLSQTAMVVHWQKKKRNGARNVGWQQLFNGLGALTTALVLVLVIITKFLLGAWLVIILIPLIFIMFKTINRHYVEVKAQLKVGTKPEADTLIRQMPVNRHRKHTVLVPISGINRVSLATMDFANSLGDDVTALFISDEPEGIEEIRNKWNCYEIDTPLVILENPFRSIIPPLLNYIDMVSSKDPDDVLMVVLPEFVARRWWEQVLHNQTALRIRSALLYRPGIVVVDVPYHLGRKELQTTNTP